MIIKKTKAKKKLPPEKVKKLMSAFCRGIAFAVPGVNVNLIMNILDSIIKTEQLRIKEKE